jgi:putative colanic acid biosynthesis acetyltransferase WcaF
MKVKTKTNINSPVFGLKNKLARVLWAVVYNTLFRFSPSFFFAFRCFLLRAFGAKIGKGCRIYPSVKIWLPANLVLEDMASIGPNVNVYNQGTIQLGEKVIVSQGAHLCASSHDYNDPIHALTLGPITIKKNVWICAEAFVGPNVVLAAGSVVGARAVVTKNTEQWCVYAGNPAIRLKERKRFE